MTRSEPDPIRPIDTPNPDYTQLFENHVFYK
jgi:hypothetical protein